MKRINFKLIFAFIMVILSIAMTSILVPATMEKLMDSDSTSQRIIIIDKQTGDTLLNRSVDSFSPKELDKLTKYLNER
jgi:hypothetical protein